MTKTVMLTRSTEENLLLKQKLELLGYKTIECSVLRYENLDFDLLGTKKIIVTSKYAAGLLPYIEKGSIVAFVVGKHTTDILTYKGYKVEITARNVAELALILSTQTPAQSDIWYLSGDIITASMPGNINRKIIYKTHYTESLSDAQIAQITKGVDFVLLYSRNSAKTLISLLEKYELLSVLQKAKIITISDKVSEVVRPYFNAVVTASCGQNLLEYM